MAQTPIRYTLRSGDRANNARDIWGVLFSILLPFLVAGLQWIQMHTLIRFDESYIHVLEGAFITFGGSAISRWYMSRIKAEDQAALDAESERAQLASELQLADAELGRLRAALAAKGDGLASITLTQEQP